MQKMRNRLPHLHQVVDQVLDRRLPQLLVETVDDDAQEPRTTAKTHFLLQDSLLMSTRMWSLRFNAAAPEGLSESRAMMTWNNKLLPRIPSSLTMNFLGTLIRLLHFRSYRRLLLPTGSVRRRLRSLQQLVQSNGRIRLGSDYFRGPDPVIFVIVQNLYLSLRLLNLLHHR